MDIRRKLFQWMVQVLYTDKEIDSKMSQCIEHQKFVPQSEIPEEMPKEIAIKYYICWPDEAKEITTGSLRRILKNLSSGKWKSIFLTNNDNLEKNFMHLESGSGSNGILLFKIGRKTVGRLV